MPTIGERPYEDLLRWSAGLDRAGWDHGGWLLDWHRTIMSRDAVGTGVLEPDAHRKCGFGQWLYGDGADLLASDERIQSVDRIHLRMHEKAREIAQAALDEGEVDPTAYVDLLTLRGAFYSRVKMWQRELLKRLFNTDRLTGVLNRRSLDSLLADPIDDCRVFDDPCQIAIVNVDHLKRVNVRHGTRVGDDLLRAIGHHLAQRLRSTDLVVRYRGDQFLVCLPHLTADEGYSALERTRRALSGRNLSLGSDINLTASVSIGLASWDPDEDVGETIKRAEWAVSEAKHSGRNAVVVAPATA